MEEYDLDQGEEDLTLLLHAWPDIEEAVIAHGKGNRYDAGDYQTLADGLRQAFRIEVQDAPDAFGETTFRYAALYDVNSYEARKAAAGVQDRRHDLDHEIGRLAPIQGTRHPFGVLIVPSGRPVYGEVCPRVMATPAATPDLRDLPEPEPPPSDVPLIERGLHRLTPIEAPFYDALLKTKLVFAVQPRVQGPDRVYRPDFIVYYGGSAVIVELDGHEGHKTKDQRSHDSTRQLWFESKGLRMLRWTGSQVHADPDVCVQQLMAILRGDASRP
ncbi:MAG TPA: DUF559 domain-containing protein [Thermoleophilaceae bacterium]|nr:DUF559 domain-containing protein [Thermoleophilaceae bacterium]